MTQKEMLHILLEAGYESWIEDGILFTAVEDMEKDRKKVRQMFKEYGYTRSWGFKVRRNRNNG